MASVCTVRPHCGADFLYIQFAEVPWEGEMASVCTVGTQCRADYLYIQQGGGGDGYTGAGAQYAARRPLCFWYQGTAAPQYEEGLLRTGIFRELVELPENPCRCHPDWALSTNNGLHGRKRALGGLWKVVKARKLYCMAENVL